ncbi:MAG: leucine-rich repeat domain-containing protein [Crocinitomicaceae bacterium]
MKKLLLVLLITPVFHTFSQLTYVPDDNFEAWLEVNGFGNGVPNDDSVSTASVSGLPDLIPGPQGIADLTGIEDFTSISLLILDGNPVTSANFSQNTLLDYISMTSCALTSINVTQCAALETLLCANNNLTSLNVSNCPLLEVLTCTNNDLTSVDVTQNLALRELIVTLNPLTTLNVTQNTALEYLGCVQNGLSSLDVTQNTGITTLDCRNNSLTTLDVSQNTALEVFFCRSNQLSALDVSNSPNLYNLNCSVNDLRCLHAANTNDFANPLAPGSYLFVTFGNVNLPCAEVSFPTIASSSYIVDAGTSFSSSCVPNTPSNAVVQNGTVLAASIGNALYQWLDCDNGNSPIAGATDQFFTPSVTGNYAVEITVEDLCGASSSSVSDCFLVDYTSIDELLNSEKELIKIVDLTGRETEFKPNTPLIFMYSDGSVERVMEILY